MPPPYHGFTTVSWLPPTATARAHHKRGRRRGGELHQGGQHMPGSRQHHTQPRQAGQSPSQGRGQRQQKEAMALVGAIYTHLAAALTPPPPNAFEIAALVAGVMDETSAGPPTSGELLELLELVQARTALLNGPGVATTGRSPIGPKTQLKRQKRSSTCSLPWRGMQEEGGEPREPPQPARRSCPGGHRAGRRIPAQRGGRKHWPRRLTQLTHWGLRDWGHPDRTGHHRTHATSVQQRQDSEDSYRFWWGTCWRRSNEPSKRWGGGRNWWGRTTSSTST